MFFALSSDGKDSGVVKNGVLPFIIRHSLVIPVYRNEENIPGLLRALTELAPKIEEFEVVFVVDGSPDRSMSLLSEQLPLMPFAWQLIELSRNFGSFAAIRQGLALARGEFTAVMAADLQEPPELVDELFRQLRVEKYDLAVGVRKSRVDPPLTRMTSKAYWTLYRSLVMQEIPAGGVDVFACNQAFREALLSLEERNSFLIGQLFWLGFRRIEIPYERRARVVGKSAWTFLRRLRYMLDSVFAFSDLPISVLLWMGALGAVVSFGWSLALVLLKAFGLIDVRGYVPIMLAIMFFGSLLLLSQGILGCYLWRVAENTKKRPISVVLSHRSGPSLATPADAGSAESA
jgi:glycosyltransferase involved in cell wall biosynthesis